MTMRLLLLALWCISGAMAAIAFAPRREGRFAWVPTATLFGPLWIAVAYEQGQERR